jgi:Transposase IS66 family
MRLRTSDHGRRRAEAPVQYGPRVAAVIVNLYTGQFLSKERTAQALAELFGIPLSSGTVAGITARAAGRLDSFLERVRDTIAAAEVAGFDETGFRVDGRLAWVHCARTGKYPLVRGLIEDRLRSWSWQLEACICAPAREAAGRALPFGHELWPGNARVSPGLERVGRDGQVDGSRFRTLGGVAAWRYGGPRWPERSFPHWAPRAAGQGSASWLPGGVSADGHAARWAQCPHPPHPAQ